jgi:hypothetical protein
MNESPGPNGASPSHSFRKERRAHVRLRCVVGASCRWNDGGESFGLVMNLSPGGARVVFWQGPEPPDHGTLHLQAGDDGFSVELTARTIHAQQCGTRWMVGYQFDRNLTDEELHKLVETASFDSVPEN